MQSSHYARDLPAILAPLNESGSNGVEDGRKQEGSGGERKKIYLYRTVDGDMVASDTLLVPPQDEVLPIIDSQPPPAGQRPSLIPLLFSVLALFTLIAVGMLSPNRQMQVRETLRVPAILLPLRTFSTSIVVIPSGKKTSPATTAHGILTITNGSILSVELPKGMIFTGTDGVETVTDAAVYVPPGSASGFGFATVSAHAAQPGTSGNIPILAIDQVDGTALYIRNLQPFSGGRDTFATTFITATDRANTVQAARTRLKAHTLAGILSRPCAEIITGSQTVFVTWHCQFVTYHIPSYMRVIGVKVQGRYLLIDVVFVARPQRIATK
jgi:hypothetical protein